jgi:Ran GTPase-activating protein (RanGAP) involved in mRNA processing and transport
MSIDASCEHIGPAGCKLIAEALRTSVTGGLTALDLSSNDLKDEGVSAVCEAILYIQSNKETNLSSLNMSENRIGPVGAKSVAAMVAVTGGLTVVNLLGNKLDAESAKMLAEVAKQKGISLCGIQLEQTTANFSHRNLMPPDAILLASDLSQAVVTGALTKIDVRWNIFGPEGAKVFADALRVNGGLTSLDLSNNELCGLNARGGTYTAEGITAIADALRVNGGLTALDLSSNDLKDEGVSAVCEAIQSNKETKLASLNMGKNRIGSVGAKSVAAMVAVTGGLTKIK